MSDNKVKYHTRLIPKSHLNLNTQTAQTVIKNNLCDTAEPSVAMSLGEYGMDVVETRLVCLGASMPYVVDEDEYKTIDCENFDGEIPEKEICYKTQFEDFSIVFDINKGKINKI